MSNEQEKIQILYDGECPFCTQYVRLIRLRKNLSPILINAREESELLQEATRAGYDLDTGMVVKYGDQLYHGASAMQMLSALSTTSDTFNRLMALLFKSKKASKLIYPVLATLRRVIVLLLGRGTIDNMAETIAKRIPVHKRRGVFIKASLREIIADPEYIIQLSIRLCCIGMLVVIPLCSGAWFFDGRILATSPIIPWMENLPQVFTTICIYLLILSCCILVFVPKYRRTLCYIPPLLFFIMVSMDELRWKPFSYFYMIVLLLTAMIPKNPTSKDLNSLRYIVLGLYFWGGLHKANIHFVANTFPWFVSPFTQNTELAILTAFFVPALESLIAVFLFFAATRFYGFVLASIMLFVVLACLGPFGHNWGSVVWPWNIILYVMEAALFLYNKEKLIIKRDIMKLPCFIAIILFCLLPALGIWNNLGEETSLKLYSGNEGAALVKLHPKDLLKIITLFPNLTFSMDNGDYINAITFTAGSCLAKTALPHSDLYHNSLTGLCRFLDKPEDAELKTISRPKLFSLEPDIKTLNLCPTPQNQ